MKHPIEKMIPEVKPPHVTHMRFFITVLHPRVGQPDLPLDPVLATDVNHRIKKRIRLLRRAKEGNWLIENDFHEITCRRLNKENTRIVRFLTEDPLPE